MKRKQVTQTVLLIAGMRDNHGREQVAEALEGVQGVMQVDVNLYRARAVILHERMCTAGDCVRAVVDAGFEAAPDAD